MTGNSNAMEKKSRWGIAGAVIGAVAASLCCIGPLVVLALGLGGAWVGTLTALEPYRPFFIVLAVAALGFAWYTIYFKPQPACKPGEACEVSANQRRNRILLWIVTLLVLGLIGFPYLIGPSSSNAAAATAGPARVEKVTLKVSGMTCGSCALGVESSLKATEGVLHVQVTLDPPYAVVEYDPTKITLEQLVAVTRRIGYPAQPLKPKAEKNTPNG